jgi:hypothetical protein
MKNHFRIVISTGIIFCGITAQVACQAQNTPAPPGKVDFASLANSPKKTGGSAKLIASAKDEDPATPPAHTANVATPAPTPASPSTPSSTAIPASVAAPLNNEAVIKELAEMKARIAQLEAELKTRSGSDDAASAERDVNALRSAEGTTSAVPEMQAAPAPPAAAAPATPEIDAQVTKKGEPFPGDWTWLNSNGHAVDSPMSTKYFTPEFRADANYTLDYNHPHDDSLGGSTETFRSDEWQLEQISAGGDIRINNVRGRILTMNGLFAMTPVRAAVNGIWRARTSTSLRHGGAIIGMWLTVSTWTPASSSHTSACSATTTSITGPISLRLSHQTRRGFSTACGYSISQPRN